ncbi:MAG: LPS export ABC transporter permease LptG [Burkholderiaceae bacterium]|jgi:lipopolysaccharide export system permease protein|nr:LPS export ABC transporter permease LptG [Burkholderiaceae bacterium]
MKTIRRLIYAEILRAIGFVTLAFLLLFFFFDFVDRLGDIAEDGTSGSAVSRALLGATLLVPGHLYELLPIAVLIGAIYVMARLAESSEYTILRTSGLRPQRALGTLLTLGLVFVVLTFVVGDYIAPSADRMAQSLQTRYLSGLTTGRTGAWMKDRQEGKRNFSVNVGALGADGAMSQIRLFEFDQATNQPLSIVKAARGHFGSDASWTLYDVERRDYSQTDGSRPAVTIDRLTEWRWPTTISSDMVAAALLSPDRMQTFDLFQYIHHLRDNGQSAQRYEIEFWRKVFYPLSCLVMMVLALPFAYLHFRSGNITGYVFLGVLVGISFFLLNNVFGFIGNLRNWEPWAAAAAPGIIYSLLSLGAFGWLVLRQ